MDRFEKIEQKKVLESKVDIIAWFKELLVDENFRAKIAGKIATAKFAENNNYSEIGDNCQEW